jgi:stage II sporulation protein D
LILRAKDAPRRAKPRRAAALLAATAGALFLSRCGPQRAVTPPPPRPVATPAPTAAATPAPSPLPVPAFPEVAEPRLDVAVATERASFALPAGDWLLRTPGSVESRRGPLSLASSAGAGVPAAVFLVQAGSFTTREAAEAERERLARELGAAPDVVESQGRFALRLGPPSDRKSAEAFLAHVRSAAVPDAFLVGAEPPTSTTARVVVTENGAARELESPVEIASRDGSPLPVFDAAYRGHLLVRATGRGTLHVIDRVAVEDYLRGVVPSEMGPKVYDELEALKAQAVAARSYALRRKGDFAAEGYDLCATPRCQAYGGVPAEQPLTDRAIAETAGEVLVFGGEVADALFTSTCGGRTEDVANVFPSYASLDVPYLSSVRCWGEAEVTLDSTLPVPKRPDTLLGVRGRALLASVRRGGTTHADLSRARAVLRERLGLPPGAAPQSFSAPSVYADLAEAAGWGDESELLTESVERARAPAEWPKRARAGYAAAVRFQLGSGAELPVDRSFAPEEAAGLWASLLTRLGDFEEVEGRLLPREGDSGIDVKSAKGRVHYALARSRLVFRGGPESFRAAARLSLTPGERVRIMVRGGEVVAVAAPAPTFSPLYERDSAWLHWTRRFTSAELAGKLRERDSSRAMTRVSSVDVLSRGVSGRAKSVRVATDRGALTLTGLEVRFSLGLPETLFTVAAGRDAGGERVFTFFGRAWGHGVGLCQNGAYGMALAGRSYREILARYYSGASVGPAPRRGEALATRAPEPRSGR